MVKKVIYLVVLIILSLCVIEKVRICILDKCFYPVMSAIAKDSPKYGLKIKCGQIKALAKDYDTAMEIFVDVFQDAPTISNKKEKFKALYELGNIYYETEEYYDAVKAYTLVLKNYPEHKKALKRFAKIKMAMKDYVEAYRYINAYVKVKPDDAFGHTERCAVLTRLGKFSAARASCEKAIEIRKGYARAHYDYAVLLKAQGFNDLAQKEYDEAIKHSKNIKSRKELEKMLNVKVNTVKLSDF